MKRATPELIERAKTTYIEALQREQHRSRGEDCDCGPEHRRLAMAPDMDLNSIVITALLRLGKVYVGAVLCAKCAHGRAIFAEIGDLPPIAQLLAQMGMM